MNESKLGDINKPRYPNEGRLLVNDLLGLVGLSVNDLRGLPAERRKIVSSQLREFFRDPKVRPILEQRDINGLTSSDANKIRSLFELPKWHSLNDIVSYVKTNIATKSEEERKEAYEEQLFSGIDANELKHSLSRIYDVFPARTETDIKHQSNLFYRAVVELVSNAVDASIKDRSPIGRFGIGFYQILNHLRDSEDRLLLSTKKDGNEGIKIEFRNHNDNIEVSINSDDTIRENGTKIELKSKDFDNKKAEDIIKDYFRYNQEVDFNLNNKEIDKWHPNNAIVEKEKPSVDIKIEKEKFSIEDHGIGMDVTTVFEKLLVPKLSNKPPVYELKDTEKADSHLYYELGEENVEKKSRAILQVGGIKIEEKKFKGVNTADTIVIDLPPFTMLGEQRDVVEVNRDTIISLKKAIDDALEIEGSGCFQVLNSLVKVCSDVQNRSKLVHNDDNIIDYFRSKVIKKFPDYDFLPNNIEFTGVELREKSILLDSNICQSSVFNNPSFRNVENWEGYGDSYLFKTKFKEGNKTGFFDINNIVYIDNRLDLNKSPIARKVNEIVRTNTNNYGNLKEAEEGKRENIVSRKEFAPSKYENLAQCVQDRYGDFYFASPEAATISARRLESKSPNITTLFNNLFEKVGNVDMYPYWDAMVWYIEKDQRDEAIKLQEIKNLTQNIEVLLSNKTIVKNLKNNDVSLISRFESKFAGTNTPEFIQKIINEEHKSRILTREDGKKFYSISEREDRGYDYKVIKYIAEDGEVIYINGQGESKYKDKDVTVYNNKIVDTKTGDIIVEIPQNFPFVDLGMDTKFKGETNEVPEKRLFDLEGYLEEERFSVFNISPSEGTFGNGKKFKIDNYGNIRVEDAPDFYENFSSIKGLKFMGVFHDRSGKVLICAYKREGSKDESKDPSEIFYVFDEEGNIISQLSGNDFGDKIKIDNEHIRRDSHPRETRSDAMRFFLVPNTEKQEGLDKNDPLVKVVRYRYIESARVRETVAYMDVSGKIVNINDAKEINKVVLENMYSIDGSCDCCGVKTEHSFGYTIHSEGEIDETTDKLHGGIKKIPAVITGEIQYDEINQEYRAQGYYKNKSRNEKTSYCVVIFNKNGVFQRTENIGSVSGVDFSNGDLREKVKYYPTKVPRSLRSKEGLKRDGDGKTVIKAGKYRESNMVIEGGFQDGNTLNADHAQVIAEFLSSSPILDKDKIERVFNRTLRFRHLQPEDLKAFLPVFLDEEYVNDDIFSEENLEILKDSYYLEKGKFKYLVNILSRCLPDSKEKQPLSILKVVKFFTEKMQDGSLDEVNEFYNYLSREKEYSNSYTSDGFTIVKNGTEIPIHEMRKEIRPFIIFMQKEEKDLARGYEGGIRMPDTPPNKINLSDIIQWKRLQETSARNFQGSPEELSNTITTTASNTNTNHIKREITHAIHFQALNFSDLYIRELIQNAVDVMKQEKIPEQDRKVKIGVFTDKNNELNTSFFDPVGMDLNTVLNYFLVPGETTKGSKEYIGYYGQGVYTLFKDAKEVQIKTGIGDGKTHYFTIKPVVENDMTVDAIIDVRSLDEDFKGTIVSKKKEVRNPYVEAAYVRSTVMSLVSALDEKNGEIIFQGEKINAEYKNLNKSNVSGLGELNVYRNPNNIVTQHGLYVKDLDNELLGGIPDFMKNSLMDWGGLVIDLPRGVELTRSRQDIASKDKMEKILNPAIQLSLTNSYLNSFIEKIESGDASFPYDQLPYDYFLEGRSVDYSVQNDFQSFISGSPLESIDKYNDKEKVVMFMTLLPILDVKDRKMSLDNLRQAFISNTFPFDQEDWYRYLPNRLTNIIKTQKDEKKAQERAREKDKEFSIGDNSIGRIIEIVSEQTENEDVKKFILENKEILIKLDTLTKDFIDVLDPIYDKSVKNEFYYSHDDSAAHAGGSRIGWNLRNLGSRLHELQNFFDSEDRDINKISRILDILAHEYAHLTEKSRWTHNSSHKIEEARVMIQFLINNGIEKVVSEK